MWSSPEQHGCLTAVFKVGLERGMVGIHEMHGVPAFVAFCWMSFSFTDLALTTLFLPTFLPSLPLQNQIDWIPLSLGSVRPTQGRTLAIAQVNGGSQSFNVVNALRVLGTSSLPLSLPPSIPPSAGPYGSTVFSVSLLSIRPSLFSSLLAHFQAGGCA